MDVLDSAEVFFGWDWEARVVERFARYTVDGVDGWGMENRLFDRLIYNRIPIFRSLYAGGASQSGTGTGRRRDEEGPSGWRRRIRRGSGQSRKSTEDA